ncbi:MAG: helix-turn-helix domain-containing protein [Candidatus Dactylopiibacterium sp.]|nr:helix-turn-helix domain-containing protein [Candidatus Dactylopiibacterium sp.]
MSETIHDPVSAAAEPAQLWERLRLAREARGMSAAEVSAHLKLTVRQIEAIERGDLSVLPGQTFAKGFVKNYARFLALDPAPFLALLSSSEPAQKSFSPSEAMSQGLGEMPVVGSRSFSMMPALALALVLAAVIGAGWHYGWFEAREDRALLESFVETQPLVSPAEGGASAVEDAPAAVAPIEAAAASAVPAPPAPLAPASAVAASVPAPVAVGSPAVPAPVASAPAASAAAEGLARLVLSFSGDSWVEVRDASGKVVFSRLNQAGNVQEVQGVAPFTLIVGNAPHVSLSWRGQAIDLAPLTRGEVARLTLK